MPCFGNSQKMTVFQPAGVLVSQQAPAQACTFDGDILLGKFYYSLLSYVAGYVQSFGQKKDIYNFKYAIKIKYASIKIMQI